MTTPSDVIATQLDEWLAFSLELVLAARSVTTPYFRTAVQGELKADDSPVTLADQETERVLREMIREYYPHHGIQGEEWGIENASAELRWVIDPIDGTRAFLAGIPTFVTLIALCHRGVPVLGVIDQPILKETWIGAAGRKTLWNNAPVPQPHRPMESLAQAMIGTTDPALFPPAASAAYARLRAACSQQISGGDGYLYGRLCSGIPHLVCEHGLKPHDLAALSPVITGAGGVITDWQGEALTLDSTGHVIAAANPALHAQALALLQDK